jgi:tripartite-type tricarboxylate transporter receptor subunit TctC
MITRSVVTLLAVIISTAWTNVPAELAAQEAFFKGKTVRLVVGSTPGGFYDRWARILPSICPSIFQARRR